MNMPSFKSWVSQKEIQGPKNSKGSQAPPMPFLHLFAMCDPSGYSKMDRVFKSLPRPVLMGCVAGMGSYLLFYGLGTSTSVDWLWTQEALREQGRHWQKLLVTLALEGFLLYLLQRAKHRDLVGLWLLVSARFLFH